MIYKSACKECGLIVEFEREDENYNYYCPRCKHIIYAPGERFSAIVVMAFVSVLLFIPTLIIPMLKLELGEFSQAITALDVIYYFFNDGNYFISTIIFFTGIVTPLFMLVLLLLILLPIHFNNKRPFYASALYQIYYDLRDWGMAEVYLISVLVSIVKLQNLGDLVIEPGIYIFFLFLICFFIATIWFNPDDIWHSNAF